jgi:Bacterial regulatory proteins, luxR family/Tetratricopeptide repeat
VTRSVAIAGRLGKLREAEQLATASVAVMRRIDHQWGAARALLGLGDLARLRGHPGEAHSWHVAALAILREIGARPEIARCLAGLGEHQIAALVASGRSNKAIADELSISHTTAARHVANIMAKLGFNSRTPTFTGLATRAPAQVRLPGAAGDPPTVRLTWSAPGGAHFRPPVVLYRIEGGGHGWPGGPQYLPARVTGRVPRHLDATKILLDSVTVE